MSFKDYWRGHFEQFAANNDDEAGIAGWSKTGLQTRVSIFRRYWQREAHKSSWLDVGCGAGTYSSLLADNSSQVFALDYSMPTLLKAREMKSNDAGYNNIHWILGDATELPLSDNQVGGAVSLGVSQALPESRPFISELVRVVDDNGVIWVDSLNKFCIVHLLAQLIRKVQKKPIHLRYESAANMRSILVDEGAVRVKVFWMPILPEKFNVLQSTINWLIPLFQIPVVCHLFCHSFLIKATK